MINFLSLEFLLRIIVGCLIVVVIYQLTRKNNDNSSLENKISAIQALLGSMKTEEDKRTGSINTALTDIDAVFDFVPSTNVLLVESVMVGEDPL